MFVKMRRGRRGCSLGEEICRGGFCVVFFLYIWSSIYRKDKTQFALMMTKENPIKKIEGSRPNSSDEEREYSAFSLSDSSALPGQCANTNSMFSWDWL